MFMKAVLGIIIVLTFCLVFRGATSAEEEPENLVRNPSFEEGQTKWELNTAGGTAAQFTVDKGDAIDGDWSAVISVDTVGGWGAYLAQRFNAAEIGEKGKTYTFSVLAKSEDGPVTIKLKIEGQGDPWPTVTVTDPVILKDDEWTELHTTFDINDDYPNGWKAYIQCTQAKAEYRADMFRLYEGEYVPFEGEGVEPPRSVSASANSLVTAWGNIKSKL